MTSGIDGFSICPTSATRAFKAITKKRPHATKQQVGGTVVVQIQTAAEMGAHQQIVHLVFIDVTGSSDRYAGVLIAGCAGKTEAFVACQFGKLQHRRKAAATVNNIRASSLIRNASARRTHDQILSTIMVQITGAGDRKSGVVAASLAIDPESGRGRQRAEINTRERAGSPSQHHMHTAGIGVPIGIGIDAASDDVIDAVAIDVDGTEAIAGRIVRIRAVDAKSVAAIERAKSRHRRCSRAAIDDKRAAVVETPCGVAAWRANEQITETIAVHITRRQRRAEKVGSGEPVKAQTLLSSGKSSRRPFWPLSPAAGIRVIVAWLEPQYRLPAASHSATRIARVSGKRDWASEREQLPWSCLVRIATAALRELERGRCIGESEA